MNKESHIENSVLLFDGVCNLCNGAVNFVLKHDRCGKIKFCPLQSDQGQALMLQNNIDPDSLSTLIYLRKGMVFTKAMAVFAVMGDMGGIWKFGVVFKVIPTVLSDFFYDLVARWRYKVFGKRQVCMVPTGEIKARFL